MWLYFRGDLTSEVPINRGSTVHNAFNLVYAWQINIITAITHSVSLWIDHKSGSCYVPLGRFHTSTDRWDHVLNYGSSTQICLLIVDMNFVRPLHRSLPVSLNPKFLCLPFYSLSASIHPLHAFLPLCISVSLPASLLTSPIFLFIQKSSYTLLSLIKANI